MTPKEIIEALEKMGITRYRISKDIGISQTQLQNWLKGKQPHDSNSHVEKLQDYYDLLVKN